MPIYEFYCPDNRRIYSFYARSLAYADRTPRCPDDAAFRMERMISSFAITGRAKEKADDAAGAPDDPRMEAMMAEMERDFGGMDAENPDPKQLARMMRRMSELGGGSVPGEVNEMIRRMEAGEDPEKLDEEFGPALENFDPLGDGESGTAESLKARLRALRARPQRDPTLYEMSDYVDEPAASPAKRSRAVSRKR
jgi:alkanesulfonate monooxygenase SsuD/methylene tetrahydromethanopterin reductase-like flavin-dependent oxidoreductase (luciferase family)